MPDRHHPHAYHETVLDEMTWVIFEVLEKFEFCWQQISDYLTSLIAENSNFLEGDEFLKLLFEDEPYTWSRTYFWILGCLRYFKNTLRDTKKHWEVFQCSYIDRVKDYPEYYESNASKFVTKIGITIAFLYRIQREFSAMRPQITLLRDGVGLTHFFSHQIILLTFSAAL